MTKSAHGTLDRLTGLPGRAVFEAEFPGALRRAVAADAPLALGIVDVDWFGKVNEERGREGADLALKALADRLHEAFSASARVYRYGGDAFAVLWEGVTKEEAFMRLEQFRRGQADEGLPFSVGLAACPDEGTEAQDVLQRAYEAVYRAKVSGRNQSCLPREEKMVPKTSYYTQGQLMGLRRLAERGGISDALLLREALNDLLAKYAHRIVPGE